MARSPIFDGVDPALLALIQQVGGSYAPYKTNIISGYRAGDPRFHGRGSALDVQLSDPTSGAALANYQDPKTAAAYQQFANSVYNAASPELKAKLRWGGYFKEGGPGSYGALDLMHFDIGGDTTPMAGGSWAGGFNDEQAKLWNIAAGGGVGGEQQGPPMPNAPMNYTPEQRRAAIASLESAGSGDYSARGPVTGRNGDQAIGRYQIMASNIPVWSKEVLGREVSVDEFLADPKLQDAIFDKKFGDYVAKYGEGGAAQAWFSGPGNVGKEGAMDALGTTNKAYKDKYLAALGKPLDMGPAYPAQKSPPAAGGAPPATADPKDPNAWIKDSVANLGSGFAASPSSVQSAPLAKPLATMTMPQPGPGLASGAGDAGRQQLAQALMRLNSGKLYG